MNILFIGDIFGSPGRRIVADHRAGHRHRQPDRPGHCQCGECRGRLRHHAGDRGGPVRLGIDVLTTGNHVWDKREIFDYFEPAAAPAASGELSRRGPGSGVVVVKARNGVECAVINLQGRTYMPSTDCPFRKADHS